MQEPDLHYRPMPMPMPVFLTNADRLSPNCNVVMVLPSNIFRSTLYFSSTMAYYVLVFTKSSGEKGKIKAWRLYGEILPFKVSTHCLFTLEIRLRKFAYANKILIFTVEEGASFHGEFIHKRPGGFLGPIHTMLNQSL